MRQQLLRLSSPRARQGQSRHNEVVFDPAPWVSGLPGTIEAFFALPGSTPEDVAKVRRAHAAFVREHAGGAAAGSTPLLVRPGV